MAAPQLIPFDDRDGFIWLNGKLVAWRDAKVHVLTHALHYASAVFEGERAYSGHVFKSREHSERLINSGTVTIESAGDSGATVLRKIPDSDGVQQLLNHMIEEDADRRAWESAGYIRGDGQYVPREFGRAGYTDDGPEDDADSAEHRTRRL